MRPKRRRCTSKQRPGCRPKTRTSTTSSRARTKSSVVPSSRGRSSPRTNSSKRSGVGRGPDLLRPPALFLVAFLAYFPPTPVRLFHDITAESGVTFQHHSAPDKRFIVESMSGGVALLDFDNDDLIDMYFVDSLTVDTAKNPAAARSALYRNLGNGKFEDVTDKAGVGHPGWGMGVC